MSEEIKIKIKELYDKITQYPNKVYEIFKDFFGEENVDLQNLYTPEALTLFLENNPLRTFLGNRDNFFRDKSVKKLSSEYIDMLSDLIDQGALDCAATSSEALAEYFLPIMDKAILSYPTMPNCFILVHFPKVRVTNEHNKHVDITHLYVKVEVNLSGRIVGTFSMNRSEYPIEHINYDYLHSHVSGIPTSDFTRFKNPCLGTGPIIKTISTLACGYDESIWRLFCLELDRYVTIESVSGVPYRYLEKIGINKGSTVKEKFSMGNDKFKDLPISIQENSNMIESFVRHLIEKRVFKFNYSNGSYGFAMSFIDYMILISNEFIEWYNREYNEEVYKYSYSDLLTKEFLFKCKIDNNKIIIPNNLNNANISNKYEGKYMCTFKGNPVKIHITYNTKEGDENATVLLNTMLAEIIARTILTIVNYNYGRELTEEVRTNTPTEYL